jgi:hypothetical protein
MAITQEQAEKIQQRIKDEVPTGKQDHVFLHGTTTEINPNGGEEVTLLIDSACPGGPQIEEAARKIFTEVVGRAPAHGDLSTRDWVGNTKSGQSGKRYL